MEGYLYFPPMQGDNYKAPLWCELIRNTLKAIPYDFRSKPSQEDIQQERENRRWCMMPNTELRKGVTYHYIGKGFELDLSTIIRVEVSNVNDCLLTLLQKNNDSENCIPICILAPSQKERELWLIGFSSTISKSPKPIPIGSANALLHCLNMIERYRGEKEQKIFRRNGNPQETSNLYRNLLLSTNMTDKTKLCEETSIHSLASTVKRLIERYSESLLTNLYPEFVEVYANSSFKRAKSKHKLRVLNANTRTSESAVNSDRCTYSKVKESMNNTSISFSMPVEYEHNYFLPSIRQLLLRLPPMNYLLLKRIIQICSYVCNSRESGFSADAYTLSITLGATLLPIGNKDNLVTLRETLSPVFVSLISNIENLFDDEKVEFFNETERNNQTEMKCLEDDRNLLQSIFKAYNIESLAEFSWPTLSELESWYNDSFFFSNISKPKKFSA